MIYENIRGLCEKNGTTIGTLEKKLGFGVSTIQSWKRVCPRVDKVKAVADYFGVTVDRLIGGDRASDFSGKITVLRNGEAVCGGAFHDLWEMVELVRIFGRGKPLSIEIVSDDMETRQVLNSSEDSGPQE